LKKLYKTGIFWDDSPPPKPPKAEKPKRMAPDPVWLRHDYLPNLDEAVSFPVKVQTFGDVALAVARKQHYAVDVEVYHNYFLACCTNLTDGSVWFTEIGEGFQFNANTLKYILNNCVIYTFNGINYDMPMLALALAGCTTEQIKEASDGIIVGKERASDVLRTHKVKKLECDHIDLKEVAPLQGSLKVYAGRLHARKMQDLPFAPHLILSPEQIAITRWYCVNDTYNTALLRDCLREHIDLRYTISNEIKVDVRSKSDAQIAESVVSVEFKRLTGQWPARAQVQPGQSFRYKPPPFIKFNSPLMRDVLRVVSEADFVIGEDEKLSMPETVKALAIPIAGGIYRMGKGGLHSSEKNVSHYTSDQYTIVDKDVTSFYPFIILNQGLYPKHLGPDFLTIYRSIVERRVTAKRNKDSVTADSLKIVINGLFGKFGSPFSVVYAPELLIQTTITGQLSMLMLIEALELAGISVLSANTDGMVIRVPKDRAQFDAIVAAWEAQTQFGTEEIIYKSLHCRDVNNYIAVKPDGATKTKGAYANPWSSKKNFADRLHKNPTATICTEAVERYLVDRVPIRDTIINEKNLNKFLVVRSVKGGAVKIWDDGHSEFLGKTVRWYYGREVDGSFVYALTGNKVPASEGAKPMMVIPNVFPHDIDYEWYIHNALKILTSVGAN
jgi:hypothetical protein